MRLTEAQRQLVSDNLGFATYIARRLRRWPIYRRRPLLELRSAAWLGLCEAACEYDPDRGVRFTTYAAHWIRRRIQDEILQNGAVTVPAACLRGGLEDMTDSTAVAAAVAFAPHASINAPFVPEPEQHDSGDESDELTGALEKLSVRQRAALLLRLRGLSLACAGGIMNCAQENVRQLEKRATVVARKETMAFKPTAKNRLFRWIDDSRVCCEFEVLLIEDLPRVAQHAALHMLMLTPDHPGRLQCANLHVDRKGMKAGWVDLYTPNPAELVPGKLLLRLAHVAETVWSVAGDLTATESARPSMDRAN